jgi:MFS family permease
MDIDLNKRYQTMLVLWFALLMSVVMYLVLTLLVRPSINRDLDNSLRSSLIFALTALGTVLVVISFPVKNKLLERSVEKQDINLVQKALIFACAICEVSALLGLIEFFIVGNREYYLLLALAAGGIALHFPRRSQLEAASYQSRNTLT